jgi:hypothetical protein
MLKHDFQSFVDNYSHARDFEKIKFDWNGLYADKFHDINYHFRTQLCEFLMPQLSSANIELIRDIYLELGKCSAATWSIHSYFRFYGQELLRRDWRKYLNDYMEGAGNSVDSYPTSGAIEIDKDVALEIAAHLQNEIKTVNSDQLKRRLEGFIKRFQWLANKK